MLNNMNIQRSLALVIALLVVLYAPARAQQPGDTAQLFTSLKRLESALQSSPVSFSIRYTYVSEKQPDVVLDSLSGSFELSGTSGRFMIDNMVTVCNSRYNIIVFPDDKLIYVSKPAPLAQADLVAQLRALITSSGISKCLVTATKDAGVISVYFKEGGPCREMNIYTDPRTGYMRNVVYVLKTSMLTGQLKTDETTLDTYGEYAIVRMDFSDYKKLAAGDTARFDESNYFYREGEAFKPAPAYKEYQIFKGSPNL